MQYLFSMAILLLMLAPKNQDLPDEFYQIPEHIRQTATVIISGTYAQGRTPCIFRPDGTRVWLIDSRFDIKRVYRGKVGSKSIRINKAMLPKTSYVTERLELGHEYLVLMRPDKEKMKKIKTEEGIGFWDAIKDEEIIGIVELR